MEINFFCNAGHYNSDSGAKANGLIERDEVMKIRNAIKSKLDAFYVPDDLDLRHSIDWVNTQCKTEDIAIDIHLNSNINKAINGTEVYYYKNKELAKKFSKAISDKIGTKDNGAIPDTQTYVGELGWVRQLKCRAVVIECLYISNLYDKMRLDYEKIADAIISVVTEPVVVQCEEEKNTIRQLLAFIVNYFKQYG